MESPRYLADSDTAATLGAHHQADFASLAFRMPSGASDPDVLGEILR